MSDIGTHDAPNGSSDETAVSRAAEAPAAPAADSSSQRRTAGRVHWDTGAPIRRIRGNSGTTVTVRSPPSSSVRRANHPGALNLSSRLQAAADAAQAQQSLGLPAGAHLEQQPQSSHSASENHALPAQQSVPALMLQGAKGLDEQGLDNRAFLELQRELQRHEESTVSSLAGIPASGTAGAGVGAADGGAAAQDEAEALEGQDRHTELDLRPMHTRRRRVHRPDTPDWSSGATTPITESSDSGSYDPANDSELDHVELLPGETDGMPSRIKRSENETAADEQPRGWARLRSLLGNKPTPQGEDEAEAQHKTARDAEKSYEEGGPTNLKSVPVTTSSGTRPAGPRSRATRYEREAAKLIRAHKLMTGGSRGLDDDLGGFAAAGPTTRRDHLESGASTPDALETAANLSAKPVTSGGVLGNLLRLYEQQQQEENLRRKVASASQADSIAGTSPLSTPGIGAGGVDALDQAAQDVLREQALGVSAGDESRRQSEATSAINSLTGYSGGQTRKQRKSGLSTGSSPGWTPGALVGGVAGAGKKAVAIAAKETGLDTLEDAVDERPKASRSSAGVFGALVATTGNLIGAVSPHHAQLGPNPKRSGYTLDRYLLPEMNAKTLRRTAEIVADAAPRPMYRSRPGTPGHHSPNNAISRKDTRDSSETHGGTPTSPGAQTPTKKRPASLTNVRGALHPSRKGTAASNLTAGSTTGGGGFYSHLPHMPHFSRSAVNTPDALGNVRSDYFPSNGNGSIDDEKLAKLEWQRKLRKRAKDKRKKEEIFITMHVAAILQRQEFILKLSRALMMFGAPTHRIETQIQQTARVLDINCRCIYLPNLMLFAFGDDATHTSETKFIKQPGGLDLTKLTDMHSIYWNVIHDKIGVEEASRQLDELMRRKPFIGRLTMILIGGFCSSFICVGSQGFGGSFVDALAAFPLGMFLVFSQLVITTEVFSNVFEILFAALNSFAAAGLASTQYFCYNAVISGSIVLILPGFLVLTGALELQSKNLIAGSVRLVYAIIYSLFLGIGISIGASLWALFAGTFHARFTTVQCGEVHAKIDQWWGIDPNPYWAFLTVPGYATALSLRNQAKFTRKEFPVMVLIAIAGWAVNHFASTSAALRARSDVTSALGALTVGLLSNVFGRLYDGKSYTVAAVGVLYQLPSGLSAGPNGSLLNFANTENTSQDSFNSGFQVAQGLVEVALGLTIGLYAATVIAYVVGGRKVRGGGLFSF